MTSKDHLIVVHRYAPSREEDMMGLKLKDGKKLATCHINFHGPNDCSVSWTLSLDVCFLFLQFVSFKSITVAHCS